MWCSTGEAVERAVTAPRPNSSAGCTRFRTAAELGVRRTVGLETVQAARPWCRPTSAGEMLRAVRCRASCRPGRRRTPSARTPLSPRARTNRASPLGKRLPCNLRKLQNTSSTRGSQSCKRRGALAARRDARAAGARRAADMAPAAPLGAGPSAWPPSPPPARWRLRRLHASLRFHEGTASHRGEGAGATRTSVPCAPPGRGATEPR